MAKIPVDSAGVFPTPEEAATRSETSSRLHAYFDKKPVAPAAPVEEAPPAGEVVEKTKPGMGDLHMREEEEQDRQDRKGVQSWESLKLDAGLNEKPGMGELRAIEERDMPHAEEVNALVKERQNLSDSDERAHEIDAKLSPSGKKAWEAEDEDPGTPQATTPFAMAARLFAPETTGSALQNYKAVQAKAKVGTGEVEEENALKMYSAQDEARRFKERLSVDAGDVPIDISRSADGTIQLDTRPFQDKLILSQREVFSKEAGYAGWHEIGDELARQKGFTRFEDAPKEVQELARQQQMDFEQKAEDWARTEITRAGQVGRHLVFVDTDPEGTNKRIAAEEPGIMRDLDAALAPDASISLTPGAKDFQPVRYGSYVWKALNTVPAIVGSKEKMYSKSVAPAMFANGDYAGWWAAGRSAMWGETPEEAMELTEAIRSNPFIAEHIADISGKLAEETANSLGYTEEQGKEAAAWARFSGGAFGFVTGDMAMPDPVTMFLSFLGMGAKWAGAGLKEYKYNKTAEYLMEQANASHLEYSEFIDNIRKTDPVAANILEMRISQEFQMHTKIRAAIREAEEAAKKAAKMADEARAKAGINAGDEAAHVAASQAEADARVAEANLAAQRRMAEEHALKQSKASRAQGQVAEKTWKDWQTAKQKAADAKAALNAHVGTHAADITAHRGAQTALNDKAVAIEKAVKDLKDAQTAKTDAIVAAKAELDMARKELAAAAAAKDAAATTAAADRLQAAKSAVKAAGEAAHPLNVAIKDAGVARTKAIAEHAAAQTEAMAQHTLHGPKVEEGVKLEKAATKAMDNESRLQALVKSMGVDPTSGVHPTAQIEQALKNAVTGARVAEAHAMSRVKNAGDILAHAEKTMQRAVQEAETAQRATGWRDTARQMASDMQKGIKEYQKWQDTGGKVEDIVKPAAVKGVQPDIPHAPGTIVVDPLSLFTSMKKKYGEAAIDHAMSERGPFGDLLRKLFDGVDDGSRAVHDGKDAVVITQKEIELLQDHPTFMTMAVRRSGNDAPAVVLVEAMELARKFDPSIKPAGLHARLLQNAVNFYEAAFPKDVLRTAIGPTKSAVQQVIKGATNLSAQIDDEMLTIIRKVRLEDLDSAIVNEVIEKFGFNPEIGKRAGKGGLSVSSVTGQLFYSDEERAVTQIAALVQYMDTTKGMEYVGGKTFVNTTSIETTWQIARRKMVYGDQRSREWNVAMDAWEREVAQIQIDYDEARRAYEEAGANVGATTGTSVASRWAQLQNKMAVKPVPPVFPPRPALGPSAGETLSPITAMARAWLPAFTTADANVAAGLETSAIKALRDNMQGQGSFLDMVVALRGHTARPTGIGMGEVDFSPSKAIGFAARAASHARVLSTADDLMYRAIGGLLTAEQVADMNKFARGQWTEVEDFTSMMEAFNRLGQPITQMSPKKVDSAGKISDIVTHFVETGRSETGESFFMGQNLLQKIEENMPKVTKELEDRAAKAHLPEQILGVQAEQFLIAQWKKSIITGTVIPNMHYWAANVAGDFSQMWFTPGVGPFTAVKQSFQNLPANIPGIGPIFQDFMSEMSYKAQGKPVLGTLTNAFFNPYLSKFWNGGEGVFRFKSGMTLEVSTARKWAVEDGILDTFLHEELPEAFSRVTPSAWKKVVSGWSDHITQFANFAQQRQRSGLYLELLSQGYTRDEARRLTLDALYDWKHAVAEHEISGWAKQIPFYRFFRLQQRQVFSAFADSFVKPEEAFGLALAGQSKLGSARSQATFVDLISKSKTWLNPEAQAPYADAQAQRDQMQTVLYPSWMRDRGVLGVNKLKDDYVRMLQNANGKIYTHEATTQLPFTIVDGLTMQMGILESLVAAVAGKKEQLAPDWKESFWEPSLNMLSPIVRDPLKAFLGDITSDPTGIKPGKTAKVTPGEAEVMNFLSRSGLYDKVVPDEKGELRTSTAQAFIFRMTSVVGTEVPKFMDSTTWNNAPTMVYRDKLKRAARDREMARVAETPERAAELLADAERLEGEAPDEVGAMMSWFLRKQLGVGAHPFNPDEEIGRREKSIEEAYKIISGEVEAPPFQPYLAPVEER